MLYALPKPGPRVGLLTRAAREAGWRSLREDPCAFARLLERTIEAHDRWFVPRSAPGGLTREEVRLHAGRLETLVDEAVELAAELYPDGRRDTVLLAIAKNAERLMRRIWSDPWTCGADLIDALGRPHGSPARDRLRSLRLVKSSRADTAP